MKALQPLYVLMAWPEEAEAVSVLQLLAVQPPAVASLLLQDEELQLSQPAADEPQEGTRALSQLGIRLLLLLLPAGLEQGTSTVWWSMRPCRCW